MINPYYEQYMINKRIKQEESFNILDQYKTKIRSNTKFIFLNKSKYSTSSKDFIKDINQYMCSDIVIYLFHLEEIKEFIKPFNLNSITLEHLIRAFEYFNDSNYNTIKESNIIEFIKKNNFKNEYFFYLL